MRNRKWLWVLGACAVIAIPLIWIAASERQGRAMLEEQLRLAREEGIPTTADEYKARIEPAPAGENAAPLYRQLKGKFGYKTNSRAAEYDLAVNPSPTNLANAEALLQARQPVLRIADEAAKLQRCWFDRDWSSGFGVLFGEYGSMRGAAVALALRGTVKASKGYAGAAIEDVDEIFAIARHAGEEPHAIGGLMQESIYGIGLQHLATWAMVHRDRPEYLEALKKAVSKFPLPNLRKENLPRLYEMLLLVDQSTSPAGRKLIGIREEDVPVIAKLSPGLGRTRARADIVKAERDMWAALSRPMKERPALLAKADSELREALKAYPVAAQFFDAFGFGSGSFAWREQMWLAKRAEYLAAIRALSGASTPAAIDTQDLVSPFDGTPLAYRFDGRQITIAVSGSTQDRYVPPLQIPPSP